MELPTFNTTNLMNEEFNNNNLSDNTQSLMEKKTIVLIEARGKKKNTYIIYLKASDEEKRTYLKLLKNRCACGGSIKNIEYDSVQENVIHLQGSHGDSVIKYLSEKNVTNVILK